ncbi:AMP-binding protein [Pelistega sp. NLN82]|uniref:AMP-binding protein n=1 Tax=Pelistega ratti TaxID=2652177 RepID=A0A6L9Y658_9BURK|nr:AMP-binding protein [Pelistega ratti]NEN75304.1 AMP-binding protein [Pelistega ratti]
MMQVFNNTQKIEIQNFLLDIYHNIFNDSLQNKTALIYNGNHISYRDLKLNISKIIAFLEQQNKIKQNNIIAICLPKSPEYIYVVIACLLTHTIWVPIDIDSPEKRQQYLLKNSQANIAIAHKVIKGLKTITIEEIYQSTITPTNLYTTPPKTLDSSASYYLYTSGSTGTPKCVILNNLATANVLEQTINRWHLTQDDIFIAITPFHHDMSIFDILAPLSIRATLVIPTINQRKNASDWASLIEKYKVSIWCSVPAILDMLLLIALPYQIQSLRLIAQGGDYIKPSLIQILRQYLPNTQLFSLGGPTETTIWSIWHEILEQDKEQIPYGKPLKHNEYYILDDNLIPLPKGSIGTMYMSGVNLSNGYLLNGQIITKDFITINIDNKKKIAFKMSDQGYIREDGNIIFVSREEGYLKIKGVRIAASEIESIILQHPTIHSAIALTCLNPSTDYSELVIIYQLKTTQNNLSSQMIKSYLQELLPISHIPSKLLEVNEVPLTVNGKIDRKKLQYIAQETLYPSNKISYTEREKEILHILLDINSSQNTKISYPPLSSKLLTLNIRPKKILQLSKYCEQYLNIKTNFQELASCITLGDLFRYIEQKLL